MQAHEGALFNLNEVGAVPKDALGCAKNDQEVSRMGRGARENNALVGNSEGYGVERGH